MDRIILASQSPRRKQLMEWAEIDFEVIVHETDESFPPGLDLEDVPVHIARNKAYAVQALLAGAPRMIIAADTIVALDGEVIGKPRDRKEAIEILSRLSDRKHLVITGVVMVQGKKEIAFRDITEVWFHELSTGQIEFYVDKYNPYDKAGAYAIQEWIGVVGIKAIHGDFYNVMGFPVSRVVRELKNW
jgi:septum formation protein